MIFDSSVEEIGIGPSTGTLTLRKGQETPQTTDTVGFGLKLRLRMWSYLLGSLSNHFREVRSISLRCNLVVRSFLDYSESPGLLAH